LAARLTTTISLPAMRKSPAIIAVSASMSERLCSRIGAGTSVFTPKPTARAAPRPKPDPRTPEPTPEGRRRKPRRRRLLRIAAVLLPVVLLVTLLGGFLFARSVFNRIEKIPLADVLSPKAGPGTNYLIVGSDSRDVEDLADAGLNPDAFADGGGQRSDTMLLLRFEGGRASMMSIPRDLYVPIAETGQSGKINSAYNGGPPRLVLTVQESLGVPVHHYLEVDFVSFAGLVDALGGITIEVPNPAFDTSSGLAIPSAGPNQLDGPQALAFVRSRHFVEVIDGELVPDPTADLGRVVRQQQFLRAVFSELGSTKNPVALGQAASATSDGLRIDDTFGMVEALSRR
jgi:LCP family protein required for cell wall assembly